LTPRSRFILVIVLVIAIAFSVGAVVYLFTGGRSHTGGSHLQNILIIASITGFNDSADHGVPQNSWPVIDVAKGTLVNITVYNTDKQAHGFQVSHYFDQSIETVAPGQRLNVSFMANESGTFRIYCSIPCTVHWAMQSGALVVT
jgi:hypothetical protein